MSEPTLADIKQAIVDLAQSQATSSDISRQRGEDLVGIKYSVKHVEETLSRLVALIDGNGSNKGFKTQLASLETDVAELKSWRNESKTDSKTNWRMIAQALIGILATGLVALIGWLISRKS